MKNPHSDVYVRLRPSKIHGIGVFAIRRIPKNTNIFKSNIDYELVYVTKEDVKNMKTSDEIKKLYNDFCICRNGEFYCPKSFNDMNIRWYLNHSENPNVITERSEKGLIFVSSRIIERNEELVVNYKTYSDD